MASGVHLRTTVVMFVEDNVETLELYASALRAEGLLVAEVTTLEEALAVAPSVRPDLIVLDRNLPDGDGWDLVRAVRQLPSMRTTPVVAFTSNRGRADVEHALVAGCDVFLEKPCTKTTFVSHVKALLEIQEEKAAIPA
jgi:two-component system CheB/CheR fusion protein